MYSFDEKPNNSSYKALLESLKQGRTPVALTGVGSVQKAFVCHALFSDLKTQIIYIAPDDSAANEARANLSAFFGGKTAYFPAKEISFFAADARSKENDFERLAALGDFSSGAAKVLVTTPQAALQFTADPDYIKNACFELKTGGFGDIEDVVRKLIGLGYTRTELVEGKGQFARRGGIVDVFSPSLEQPVRIEFWGDDIDCMGTFDLYTQRRIENIKKIKIVPVAEFGPTAEDREKIAKKLRSLAKKYGPKGLDVSQLESSAEAVETGRDAACERYLTFVKDNPFTLLDYFKNAIVCIADEDKADITLKNCLALLDEDIKSGIERGVLFAETCRTTLSKTDYYRAIENSRTVYLDNFLHSYKEVKPVDITAFSGKQLGTTDDIALLGDDIDSYSQSGYKVYVAVRDEKRAPVMRRLLEERNLRAEVCVLPITGGMEITDMRLVVLCDKRSDFKRRKKRRLPQNSERIKSYNDLNPGDYVVHVNHGIGQYQGIEKLTVRGITKDYIKLKYSGSDMLYIPSNQLDLISKYVSGDTDAKVKLSKIGGTDWAKTKARVKKAVADMADGLIALYSERQSVKGYAFSPDTEWQKEFEERFEYTETDDQLRSAREIKTDMEKPIPMERLLCGDVGFGKTEVAMRAVFKCVSDGKQAAILVPTTILAWQHFQTLTTRFTGVPVNIEVLSRYRTKKQQEQIVRKLKRGEIDVIVGTHRLIQKDVVFKDLGLIVVDEEQRFGVAHKERLKEMTKNVDSLTLTATPIPRTLSMALSGIRDMSLIEEPPRDRQPVATYVMEHDFGVLCEAMRQELRRGGQVFFLHNRIETIELTAAKIARELPDKNVEFAHGKMSEQQLSEIWDSVVSGDIDVLVCTTIIETGIDVANANTLIVEDADRMGLSQLYQLRGRVGRSRRRAYCYLTYRRGKALSEDAEKRLSAVREFTEFGSGFKIAMRDLEIRGAGNILGAEQSGHLEAVGYDLYVKLLDEAVKMKKGEIQTERQECVFDIPISAHIPFDYVESSAARIDLYKKIALLTDESDLADLEDELCDRFGDIPEPTMTLCRIALIRNMATEAGIAEIREENGRAVIEASKLEMEALSGAAALFSGKLTYIPSPEPVVRILPRQGLTLLDECETFIREYCDRRKKK